jgi:hypothetical protein
MLHFGASGFRNLQRLPMNIDRSTEREMDDARSDSLVGELVNDNERS